MVAVTPYTKEKTKEDPLMDQQKKHDLALMRYSVIAPLITGLSDDYTSLEAFYRDASARGVIHPDGFVKHYAPGTIEKWYRNYKQDGFDALIPTSRTDLGVPRKLDEQLQEQILYLKTNYPRMSSSAIYRQLKDNGSIKAGELSESTVNRFVNVISIQLKTTTNQDMRRYERPHINEVWCGDSSVGPYLTTSDGKKHKVYIIALIDDASRFIVGIDVFFHDNFVNLMSVMKSAVAKYGRPKMFNFDNGSSYKNKQMELLAARIGSVVHYDQPYSPTQKAKIERWFRTMKDQWMSSLDIRDFHSLEELRGNLFAYVQIYNQTVHSSLKGASPQDRFFSEPECIRRLSDFEIENSFLLEIERRVSADSVIVIDQVEYEVDYRFAKQRIRLRYSPNLEDIFIVEADGTLTPIRLLNKTDNSNIKRDKIHLCRGHALQGGQ
jgi:putative transposase